VKKIFALLAVCSLAIFVGCDDKKSTGKPTNATTGGTYVKTDTVRHDVTATVTDTVIHNTRADTRLNTVVVTTTVAGTKPTDGPKPPPAGDKDKKPGDR
jgi:hypothetical protein